MLCFDVFCVVFFSFPGLVMGSGFDYVSIGFIFSCLWFSQSHQAGILRIAISLILGVVTTVAPPTHPADQLAMFQSVHRVVLGPTKGLPPRKPNTTATPQEAEQEGACFFRRSTRHVYNSHNEPIQNNKPAQGCKTSKPC